MSCAEVRLTGKRSVPKNIYHDHEATERGDVKMAIVKHLTATSDVTNKRPPQMMNEEEQNRREQIYKRFHGHRACPAKEDERF